MRHSSPLAAALVAALWFPLGPKLASPATEGAATMPGFTHGFRVDPMRFVTRSTSLQGALVRRLVFHAPADGDAALLTEHIAAILAQQKPDGGFPADGPDSEAGATGNKLRELLDCGADPARPELQRAADFICAQSPGPPDEMGQRIYFVEVLVRCGRGESPFVRNCVQWLGDHPEKWIGAGCPWTPEMALRELWAAREVQDSSALIERGLRWMLDNMNAAGCLRYWDPMGFVTAAADIDHPLCREVLRREVPMLLRGQRGDGGWGDNTLSVLKALVRWDLLEPLRALPPLPEDWRITGSVPLPEGGWWGMTYGDGLLWLRDDPRGEVVGVSPADGSEQRRLKLPGKTHGIGWWDDGLAVTMGDPARVVKLRPADGEVLEQIVLPDGMWVNNSVQVGGKLLVADGYMFPGWRVDPAQPDKVEALDPFLAGPGPVHWAPLADGVWHFDWCTAMLIKSSPHGELLDFAARPFGDDLIGMASEGNTLWVLDPSHHRICRVVRALPAPPAELGAPNLTPAAGALTVPGVPSLGWGKSGDCTFAGALESALAVTSHPVSRTDIMGASALAFRVRWWAWTQDPSWCPSTPVGEFPEERDSISRATGWQFRDVMLPGDSASEGMAAFTPDLVAYLNAGLPVVGYPDDWNCGVCFGYQGDGAEFLWYDYWAGDTPKVLPAAKPGGPWLLFPTGWQAPPSERDALLETLRLAIRNWTRDAGPEPGGNYWYGDTAFVQWRDDLSRAPEWPPEVQAGLFFAGWWNVETLMDARACAASYLRAHAHALDGPAHEALLRAADLYRQEADLIAPSFSDHTIFLGPWTGKGIADWTPEVRAREVEVLGQCRELEQQAVALIEKALTAAK